MASSQLSFSIFIIGMYLGLNSLLNLLNRWALGLYGLRFPLIMTSCHMIFGCIALSPMLMTNEAYTSRHSSVIQNGAPHRARARALPGAPARRSPARLLAPRARTRPAGRRRAQTGRASA